MDKQDIPFLTASRLSDLIRSREVSPVEAVESYLDRIDDQDFRYNAYLTVCRDQAMADARRAQEEIAQGGYRGPMHGIPVAVKDQLWTRGVRSTGGSRFLADWLPDEDATIVANLKRAGAVLLGKTNMTELAITGYAHRFSTPRNPWDLDMYTGGSSSGSGAATAAFLCATSLGEDTGGSIRWPSSWCGLSGLRPTWGRVSRYGVMSGSWSMDTFGPMSRSAEDAAMTLTAIAGRDPKDQYTWDVPVPDYRAALTGDVAGLRVGLVTELSHGPIVDAQVSAAVVKAASVLADAGAAVEEVSLPLTVHSQVLTTTHIGVESAMDHRERLRSQPESYGHAVRIGLTTGSLMPAQAYYKAQKLRSMVRRQVLEALDRYDVLALAAIAIPAVPIRDDGPITGKEQVLGSLPLLTPSFNLASCPAISVPCGFTDRNMPIGLQIAGRPGEDGAVLNAAHAYQQSTRWHTIRPATV